jgi:hypothetical protein
VPHVPAQRIVIIDSPEGTKHIGKVPVGTVGQVANLENSKG